MSTRAGLTLSEVLVSSAIFALLAVVLVAVQMYCSKAMLVTNDQTDTYRMAMSTLNRIKAELSPSRLTVVDPDFLKYKLPMRNSNGSLRLNYTGIPIWLPPGAVDHMIYLDPQHQVVAARSDNAGGVTVHHLGSLGEAGTLQFSMPINQLIEVRVHAEVLAHGQSKGSRYDALIQIFPAGKT